MVVSGGVGDFGAGDRAWPNGDIDIVVDYLDVRQRIAIAEPAGDVERIELRRNRSREKWIDRCQAEVVRIETELGINDLLETG